MKLYVSFLALAVVLGLALLAVGCGTTEPEPLDPAAETIDDIRINHVASGPLLKAHFDAWSAQSVAAYDALLEKPSPGRGATGFGSTSATTIGICSRGSRIRTGTTTSRCSSFAT